MPPKAGPTSRKAAAHEGGENEDNEEEKKIEDKNAQYIESIVEGTYTTILTTVLTFYCLMGNEVKQALLSKNADIWFDLLNLFALIVFFAEFFALTVSKAEYKWSFFFCLDLVAALSIAPDIPWFHDILWNVLMLSSDEDKLQVGSGSAQTARLARLVRLVRLVRVVKIYSMLKKKEDAEQEERLRAQARAAANAKQAALKRVEASRLGKVLSEQTTRKVIVGILLMLFAMPNLSAEDLDLSKDWGLQSLFWFGQSDCTMTRAMTNNHTSSKWPQAAGGTMALSRPTLYCHGKREHADAWMFEEGWKVLIYQYSVVKKVRGYAIDGPAVAQHKLLWLHVPHLDDGRIRDVKRIESPLGTWEGSNPSCSGKRLPLECPYRESEVVLVQYAAEECSDPELVEGGNPCREVAAYARFEMKDDVVSSAYYSLIQMLLVIFIIMSLSLQFQNDTQILVISPIEKMVGIIKQLAEDPLRPPKNGAEALEEEEKAPAPTNPFAGRAKKKSGGGPQLETSMLENTIVHISGLLQRGFGAAGAEVVGANMSGGDGDLNIMLPGQKITAIFGWTNVRDFIPVMALLEEDVMMFINCIGFIVQGCVHRWSGFSNKNVGDTFLVLWKAPEIDLSMQSQQQNGMPQQNTALAVNKVSELADRSLMAFLKIFAECRRSPDVDFYNRHDLLLRNIDRWRVRIGMSLHVGWAIEGPVGSDFKIDAAYLSPTVSICEMLESATKVYGVPIIMSDSHYKLLSLRTKERIRKMDVVKCMEKVMGLYTFSVNCGAKVDETGRGAKKHQGSKLGDLLKDEGLADVSSETLESEGAEFLFVIDCDAQKLQEGLPEELESEYREALCQYLEGNWEQARKPLEKILRTIWPGDGPSTALHRVMAELSETVPGEHGFHAPLDWAGHHVMDHDTIAKGSMLPPLNLDSHEEDIVLREETTTQPKSRAMRQVKRAGHTVMAANALMRKSAVQARNSDDDRLTEHYLPGEWR